jgi:hypothetical protein
MRSGTSRCGVRNGLLTVGLGLFATMAPAQVWEVGNQIFVSGDHQAGAQFGAAIALGDFDDDGDLDVAFGAPRNGLDYSDSGRVDIFRNNGARSFAYWTAFVGLAGDRLGEALAAGDLDGDGRDELAAGRPFRDGAACTDGTVPCPDSGAVTIHRFGGVVWSVVKTLTETGAGNGPDARDYFGSVLAAGDFDGDGIDDLAVGIPNENTGAGELTTDAGKVNVFYHPVDAPSLWDDFQVAAGNLAGTVTYSDQLGAALAVGDFDGNGIDDLAMGAPGRELADSTDAGQVHVVHGFEGGGLTLVGQGLLSYASFGQAIGDYDAFGAALAAADFNVSPLVCAFAGPCYDDLAIGVPGNDVLLGASIEQAGRVLVSYGSASGLALDDFTLLSQVGLSDTPEASDHFGSYLAAGRLRFRGTTILPNLPADLAIGVQGENSATEIDTGYIHLAFGAGAGVAQGAPGEQPLPLRLGYRAGPAESWDSWGEPMAIGDLDGDGYGDLLVGVPNKSYGGEEGSGVVNRFYGAMYADGFEIGSSVNWSSTVTP